MFSSVKHCSWSPEKNEWLKRECGIGFEDVVFHIEAGDEVDLFEHPNQERYLWPENFGCPDRGLRLPGSIRRVG
jgi:hypothetical protein